MLLSGEWRQRRSSIYQGLYSSSGCLRKIENRGAGFFFCESSEYGQVTEPLPFLGCAYSVLRISEGLSGTTTVLTSMQVDYCIRPGKRVRQSYKLKFDVLMVEKIARQSDMTFKAPQGVGNHQPRDTVLLRFPLENGNSVGASFCNEYLLTRLSGVWSTTTAPCSNDRFAPPHPARRFLNIVVVVAESVNACSSEISLCPELTKVFTMNFNHIYLYVTIFYMQLSLCNHPSIINRSQSVQSSSLD